jgi:predicted nuclease of predicted toxin-antitoxin system
VKIFADVNISPRVVEHLRQAGHDAVRITDLMDARASDEEVLARAASAGAVLVSRDQDFSALVAVSGAAAPSLVNVRLSSVDPKAISDAILTVLGEAADEIEGGAVVTIDDSGARLHRLPIR